MGLEGQDNHEAPVDGSQEEPVEGLTGAEAADQLSPTALAALEEGLMSTPEGQAMGAAKDQLASLDRAPKSPLEAVLSGEVSGMEVGDVENAVSRIVSDMRFKDQLGNLRPALTLLEEGGKKVGSFFENPLLAKALPDLFEQYVGESLANSSSPSVFKEYWKSVDRVQGKKGVMKLAEGAVAKMKAKDLGEMLGEDFFCKKLSKACSGVFCSMVKFVGLSRR